MTLSSEALTLVLDVAFEPLLDLSDSRTDTSTPVLYVRGPHVSDVPMSGRMASTSCLTSCLRRHVSGRQSQGVPLTGP